MAIEKSVTNRLRAPHFESAGKFRLKALFLPSILLFMFALLLYMPQPQQACGPSSNEAIFSYTVHPDLPLERFAAGDLGVLQPTYARSYLFVAYRYLAGVGLEAEEQKQMASLWQHRLRTEPQEPGNNTPLLMWVAARKKITNAEPPQNIEIYKDLQNGDFYSYANCTKDTFQTAIKTLEERVSKYGATSPQVKEWLDAQDKVFINCSGDTPIIPPAASANAPAWLRADRDYQIAAANFYAAKFDDAEKLFTAIAADKASPWRTLAPFLSARSLVRKATLTVEEGKTDTATLRQAETRLKAVLNDNTQSGIHPSAKRILNFVNLKLQPEAQLHELALAVMQKNSGKTIWQDTYDYTTLMSRYVTDDLDDFSDEKKKFEKLPTIGRNDDVTDWLLVYQVMDKAAFNYSLQKWAKTASLPWLLAAISKADAQSPRLADLVTAAAKVPATSPAYATAIYHTLRLTIATGKKDEARRLLDSLLSTNKLPASTVNQFLALRMKVAQNLDEFLKYAQRKPAALSYNDDGFELPSDLQSEENATLKEFAKGRVAFDIDAAAAINLRMPLSVLKDAAATRTLPAYLRRNLAQAAFVRAVVLDDEAIGKEAATILQSLAPELKDNLTAYQTAASGNDKKLAGLYLILKVPGLETYVDSGVGRLTTLAEIDNYRDNWWCARYLTAEAKLNNTLSEDRQNQSAASEVAYPYPDFLTEAQKATAKKELTQLQGLGDAPNYLCAQTVRFATVKGTDPRLPEMLHLAVRATRYGCTNEQTGKFSKQAYDVLHQKYPKNEWAAKTKYWFKG